MDAEDRGSSRPRLDLEAQARYGAAAKCRAVLSRMLSGDVAGALGSSGVISDADIGANPGVSQICAALTNSLTEDYECGTA